MSGTPEPTESGTLHSTPGIEEALLAGLACMACAVALVLLCASVGALGASRNDDWGYYRALFDLADGKPFSPNGWSVMFLAGQAFLFLPLVKALGPSVAAVQVGVSLLGAGGVWCAYLMFRRFLRIGPSLLSVGCLMLGPFFGSLAVSFMTDVPAFSLEMIALALGGFALRNPRFTVPWLLASLACTTLAFTIREFAIASGIAVLGAVIAQGRRGTTSRMLLLVALSLAWIVILGALYAWRKGLPGAVDVVLGSPVTDLSASVATIAGAALTLALLLLPVVLAAAPLRLANRAWQRWRLGVLAVVIPALLLVWWRPPLLPGYLAPQVSYDSAVLGPSPDYLPVPAWKLLWFAAAGALVAIVTLALAGIGDVRAPATREGVKRTLIGHGSTGVIAPFMVVSLALAAGSILFTNAPFFDRYLIAVVPCGAALALYTARRLHLCTTTSMRIGWACMALIGLYSLGLTAAVAAVDGGKWRLASRLVAMGYAPAEIAGSMEWWGLHYGGPVVPQADRPGVPPWWLDMFGDRRACAIVAYADPHGGTAGLLDTERIDMLLGSAVTLVAKDVPGCDLARASALAGYR